MAAVYQSNALQFVTIKNNFHQFPLNKKIIATIKEINYVMLQLIQQFYRNIVKLKLKTQIRLYTY